MSSVYRKSLLTKPDKEQIENTETDDMLTDNKPGPSRFAQDSKHFDPVQTIREIKRPQELKQFEAKSNVSVPKTTTNKSQSTNNQDIPMEARNTETINRAGQSETVKNLDDSCSSTSLETQQQLERRITIEEEVTFVSNECGKVDDITLKDTYKFIWIIFSWELKKQLLSCQLNHIVNWLTSLMTFMS